MTEVTTDAPAEAEGTETPGGDQEAPSETSPEPETAVLEEKLKTTHERLLRTAADLDNLRKRTKRDVDEALARGRSDVLQEMLPVLDSIDLALASKETDGANDGILEGVQMIRKQFMAATERFGLKEVESRGKAFDPNFHEAVAHIASSDCPAGQIVDEMRKGYLIGEKLLRAAMVVVSKGGPEPSVASGNTSSDEESENSSGAASSNAGEQTN